MNFLEEFVLGDVEKITAEDIAEIRVRSVQEILDGKKLEGSVNQVERYKQGIEYVERCIEEDKFVIEQSYIKEMHLKNYAFEMKGEYIWVVDKYIKEEEKDEPYKYCTLSLGNEKLKSNEETQFLIWNVLQRVSCRNATKNCKSFCYANKYPNKYDEKSSLSAISRRKNLVFSMLSNFDEIMIELIEFVQSMAGKNTVFRWHESGDVYSRLYLRKIKKIISECSEVKFMWFTKSLIALEEINELNKLSNNVLRYSLDSSTPLDIVEKIKKLGCPTTIVMDRSIIDRYILDERAAIKYCNIYNEKGKRDKILEEIKNLTEKLEELKAEESRGKRVKTKRRETESEILKKKSKLIDPDTKCTKCLKCLNRKLNTIVFCKH